MSAMAHACMHIYALRVRVRVQALRGSRLGQIVILGGRLCHGLLKLACTDNAENQAYVSNFSAVVMSHLTAPVDAPDTLAAMYANNMTQLQTVTPEVIKATVDLIRHQGRSPRFMNFLYQMCGTRERPMPSNQVGGTVGQREGGGEGQRARGTEDWTKGLCEGQ